MRTGGTGMKISVLLCDGITHGQMDMNFARFVRPNRALGFSLALCCEAVMDLLRDFFTDVARIVQCRPFGVDSGVVNAACGETVSAR